MISVVVPIYNKVNHLSRSINSILNQTYKDFELILIDDASTDGSENLINEFKDDRIKICKRSEPGPGGYAARNLGIQNAKYDWIAFLDADDEWLPNHLELIVNAIKNNRNIRTIVTGFYFSDENGKRANKYYKLFSKEGNHVFDFNRFLQFKPCCSSAICINKEELKSVGAFPEGEALRGGDTDTWLRLFHKIRKGFWVNELTAIYHRDSENMVTKFVSYTIKNHLLYYTVQKLLQTTDDKTERSFLKSHWNATAISYFKNIAKERMLTYNDLQFYFWSNSNHKIKIFTYFIYSLKHLLK